MCEQPVTSRCQLAGELNYNVFSSMVKPNMKTKVFTFVTFDSTTTFITILWIITLL